jgi:hypothetical protein
LQKKVLGRGEQKVKKKGVKEKEGNGLFFGCCGDYPPGFGSQAWFLRVQGATVRGRCPSECVCSGEGEFEGIEVCLGKISGLAT